MRKSSLDLYLPLLVIALIQGLLIAVAPSRSPQDAQFAGAPGEAAFGTAGDPAAGSAPGATVAGGGFDGGTGAVGPSGTTGATGGAGTAAGGTGATGGAGGTAGGTGATGGGGGASTGGGSSPSGGGTGPSAIPQQGDTSHCKGNRQHKVVYNAPPCVPKWKGGNNGGATYQGVSGSTIKVLVFREAKNEQVSRILAAEGLRETAAESEAFMDAAERFLNKHYEFYGRKIDFVHFRAEACPETPPDIAACRAEAQRALKEKPFAVIWPVPVYPTVFDEFAKAGVISLGGWHADNSYFAGRRPYRYDVFMDGSRTAEFIAEYYCGKMAGGNATHAGRIIHPSFPQAGARDAQPRRVGITIPDTPANMPVGQYLKSLIDKCDDNSAVVYGYDADIQRSTEQASAITARMIDDGITTVVMVSDPIAPIFRTNNMTRNNYFPEILLPGSGLLDYDKIGRLYDPQQMAHAFGPSQLQVYVDHSDSDASRIWRAGGGQGDACGSCNLYAGYYLTVGAMLQMAGPNLNPATVETGTLSMPPNGGWKRTGGDPHIVLSQFGRNDYTAVSDLKEVFWDAQKRSPMDGRPGAYVALEGGRRYRQGELPRGFKIPTPPR